MCVLLLGETQTQTQSLLYGWVKPQKIYTINNDSQSVSLSRQSGLSQSQDLLLKTLPWTPDIARSFGR